MLFRVRRNTHETVDHHHCNLGVSHPLTLSSAGSCQTQKPRADQQFDDITSGGRGNALDTDVSARSPCFGCGIRNFHKYGACSNGSDGSTAPPTSWSFMCSTDASCLCRPAVRHLPAGPGLINRSELPPLLPDPRMPYRVETHGQYDPEEAKGQIGTARLSNKGSFSTSGKPVYEWCWKLLDRGDELELQCRGRPVAKSAYSLQDSPLF